MKIDRLLSAAARLGIAVAPADVTEHARLIDAEHNGRALYEQTTKALEVTRDRREDRR